MATFELEEALGAELQLDLPHSNEGLEGWREELRTYLVEMQNFSVLDPSEVFLRLSAFTARASEIRFLITQQESRRLLSFRTQAVDPFLEEAERQFKYHSRAAAMRELEWKVVEGGGGRHV